MLIKLITLIFTHKNKNKKSIYEHLFLTISSAKNINIKYTHSVIRQHISTLVKRKNHLFLLLPTNTHNNKT